MSTEESFSSLQLPESVIAALYPEVVVLQDAPKPATRKKEVSASTPPPAEAPSLKWLGENRSAVTLVVQYPAETFLPDEQLNFITKILGACKLNLGDVALVNHGRNPVPLAKIKEQLKPGKMILFGVDPEQLGLPIRFPEFKLQAYDGTTYLLVPTAEVMNKESEEGKLLKSKFWVCLRNLFNV